MNPSRVRVSARLGLHLDTEGSFGPDRITRNIYDDAGQLVSGPGSALGTAERRRGHPRLYRQRPAVARSVDGENNLTDYVHDGHDRLAYTFFPSATQGALTPNSGRL